MLKQKSCLRRVTFLSKSDDYKASLLHVRPFTLRAPGIFTYITCGCSRKEWELPELPGAACSLSGQQRLLVYLELLCQHWPFSCPSGKIKAGKLRCKRLLPTHMLGYWVLQSHRPANGQSSRGSFLLSSRHPWTPVLVAVVLNLPSQKCAQSDWVTQLLWVLLCRAKGLGFHFWGVLDLQVLSRGKSLSYFGI